VIKDYLRMFRAQTAPATILLILVPYLTIASLFSLEALTIGLFALFAHWISFGHNSLMDTAYDVKDPSKQHHPLVAGRISIHAAHNVIHWSLCGLAVAATILSLTVSPNPFMALTSVFLWFVFGCSYNSGLSKECLLGFLPISICFTAMGAWGWFLSHSSLNTTGWLYLGYIFFLILFQIAYEGHLKELEIKERSNILVKMGASVNGQKRFAPGKSWIFAWLIKGFNLFFGALLLLENFNTVRLMIFVLLSLAIFHRLHQLTKPRLYIRNKELLSMSIMEILTIYLAPWLILDPITTIILEVIGVAYFFGINKAIWATPYPAV
jgi:4-hydroxybenzoate polyprenyltransferase